MLLMRYYTFTNYTLKIKKKVKKLYILEYHYNPTPGTDSIMTVTIKKELTL